MSLVPKSVNENGRTLTLADVSWQEAAVDPTDGYDTVSYTHLDVYKRQESMSAENETFLTDLKAKPVDEIISHAYEIACRDNLPFVLAGSGGGVRVDFP